MTCTIGRSNSTTLAEGIVSSITNVLSSCNPTKIASRQMTGDGSKRPLLEHIKPRQEELGRIPKKNRSTSSNTAGDGGWPCRADEHLICKENEHLILLMEEILPVSKGRRCKYVKHVISALPPSPLDMQCCLVDEECLCAHEILQVNIALMGGGGRTKMRLCLCSFAHNLLHALLTCNIFSVHCTDQQLYLSAA